MPTSGDTAALIVDKSSDLMDALRVINAGREAICFVVDDEKRVVGSLTDGDVRRALLSGDSLSDRKLPEIMSPEFIAVTPEIGRAEVLDIMRARQIEQIPIVDSRGRLCGLHTLRDIIAAPVRANCAVILAGGQGTRLRPFTETVPKPMLKVAGRPIIERLVLHFMSHGVRKIFISVNYLAHLIEDHFASGERFGCEIEYLREEEPLGTGGPLSLLPQPIDSPVIVANGDLVTQCDLGKLLSFHEAGGYFATFGVRPYNFEIPFGVARVDGDRLVEIVEKPMESRLINAGIYVLSPAAVAMVPKGVHFPITDLFARCLAEGHRVGATIIEEEWLDVGRHDDLKQARGHG